MSERLGIWYGHKGYLDSKPFSELSNEEIGLIDCFICEIPTLNKNTLIIRLDIHRKSKKGITKKGIINSYISVFINTSKSQYSKHLFRLKLKNKEGDVIELQQECLDAVKEWSQVLIDNLSIIN